MKKDRSIRWILYDNISMEGWTITLEAVYRDGRRLQLKRHLDTITSAYYSNTRRFIGLKYEMMREMVLYMKGATHD